MTLTPQDVISAYKLVLGREPESAAVVDNFSMHSSFEHLCATLLGSDEFAERVGRNPHLLSVDMSALAATLQFRKHQDMRERLMSLPPLYDRSVLLAGATSVGQASFYLERRCKLRVATSGDAGGHLRRILAAHPGHTANVAAWAADVLQPIDEDESPTFDIVHGDLPDGGTDAMLVWLDNMTIACSDLLIVGFEAAAAHWEEVFATSVPGEPRRMKRVPTRSWVRARLRERFAHVRIESLVGGDGRGGRCMAFASRRASALPDGEADAAKADALKADASEAADAGRRGEAPISGAP